MNEKECAEYLEKIREMPITQNLEYGIGCLGTPNFYTLSVNNSFENKIVKIPQHHLFMDKKERIVNYAFKAFRNNSFVTDIILPKQFNLSRKMFENCVNLRRLTIPLSVDGIDFSCFLNCNNLSDIFYEGSEKNWKNIYVCDSISKVTSTGKGAVFSEEIKHIPGNEILQNVTLHYNCNWF